MVSSNSLHLFNAVLVEMGCDLLKLKKQVEWWQFLYIISNCYIMNVVICCSNLEYAGSIGCSPCIQ